MTDTNKSQTAVEILLGRWKLNGGLLMPADFQEALQTERRNIMDAHIFAHCEYGGGMISAGVDEQDEAAAEYYAVRFRKEAGV